MAAAEEEVGLALEAELEKAAEDFAVEAELATAEEEAGH